MKPKLGLCPIGKFVFRHEDARRVKRELQGYMVTPDASGDEASSSLFAPQAGEVLVETALGLMT